MSIEEHKANLTRLMALDDAEAELIVQRETFREMRRDPHARCIGSNPDGGYHVWQTDGGNRIDGLLANVWHDADSGCVKIVRFEHDGSADIEVLTR